MSADHLERGAANPLLDFAALPRFDAIEAHHIEPAIDALLAQARSAAAAVAADPSTPDWEHVVVPTERPLDELDRAFAIATHLNAVASTKTLRSAYNAVLPRVTAFHSDLAQDRDLHARYRALAADPRTTRLPPAQQRVIEHALRDFRLGGADLDPQRQARLKAIQEELALLTARFDDNLLDAEDAWSLVVTDEALLAGVPDDVKAAARDAARNAGATGWRLTLRAPSYQPLMRHASNRGLREQMFRAAATLASDLGNSAQHDNGAVIGRILALRQEEAKLVGYANYAELSLEGKMAGSPEEVLAFLRELADHVRPFAKREAAELATFAADVLGIEELAAWDIAYAAEKLSEHRYALSDEELRAWLPLDRVLAGLFRVTETLYGITVREERAPVWHPSVRFFAIRDPAGESIGEFYLDLQARQGKQGGAWMDEAVNRWRTATGLQCPVAWLTCNFPASVAGAAPKLSHRQVITLFHEFGHGLHLLLTGVDVAGISGLQGVEWDAVELPSQLMENFCWDRGVLESIGRDPASGAAIPPEFLDRLLASRYFGSARDLAHQLELALFDMLLHQRGATSVASAQAILDEVRAEVSVEPHPVWDRFIHRFGHIFAGDYAAGYYSYLWAEVMAADAFSLFEENGVLSPAIGARFRKEVLSVGGTRPALESFVAFRGRPPQIGALLRHNGLVQASEIRKAPPCS